MSKTTMQMAFNAEKLGALKQYMGKKDADLNAELEEYIQKLYEKFVPSAVREYIESRGEPEELKPKRPPRARPIKEKTDTVPPLYSPNSSDNE